MEGAMRPLPKEVRTDLVQTERGRAVVLPDDFVMEGRRIILRQERDGLITIWPGTEQGREAIRREFGLFKEDGAATAARSD
jgi:hypothetical protein